MEENSKSVSKLVIEDLTLGFPESDVYMYIPLHFAVWTLPQVHK